MIEDELVVLNHEVAKQQLQGVIQDFELEFLCHFEFGMRNGSAWRVVSVVAHDRRLTGFFINVVRAVMLHA